MQTIQTPFLTTEMWDFFCLAEGSWTPTFIQSDPSQLL